MRNRLEREPDYRGYQIVPNRVGTSLTPVSVTTQTPDGRTRQVLVDWVDLVYCATCNVWLDPEDECGHLLRCTGHDGTPTVLALGDEPVAIQWYSYDRESRAVYSDPPVPPRPPEQGDYPTVWEWVNALDRWRGRDFLGLFCYCTDATLDAGALLALIREPGAMLGTDQPRPQGRPVVNGRDDYYVMACRTGFSDGWALVFTQDADGMAGGFLLCPVCIRPKAELIRGCVVIGGL